MRTNDEHIIGLAGHGQIYQYALHHLEKIYSVAPLELDQDTQTLSDCTLVVHCSDNWSPGTLLSLNQLCHQVGVALLPAYTFFGVGFIGPCVIPHTRGCARCAELRKLAAIEEDSERELYSQHLFSNRDMDVHQPWLTPFSLDTLTQLINEECTAYLQDPDRLRTHNALLSISLETLNCKRHHFLPFPNCSDCKDLADDTPDRAIITLQSRPKIGPFNYRTRQLPDLTSLLTEYVDPITGMIQSVVVNASSNQPIATAHMRTVQRGGWITIPSTGSTSRIEQSEAVAITEILERYASLHPRSKQIQIRGSYRQLKQQNLPVLDPSILGLHTPEQYAHPETPFVSYHPNLVLNWVWGYSFQQQSPLLVPERCAYYGMVNATHDDNPPIIYEISNGCALGNNLEEAIFHGMLEVIERDAFLITWYARLGVPRLDPNSITDPALRLDIAHLEYTTGYTVHIFNMTLDHAVPCICVLGVDEQEREDMPKVRVVAGAHPHPEQALAKALGELAAALATPAQWYQEQKAHALELLADFKKIKDLVDHPLLYCLPEAFGMLSFLYQTQRQQTFQEAFHDFYQQPPMTTDLRDDLNALIDVYRKRDIDVLVIDQTAPEYATPDFHSVKVLMPGMLPMTFGQNNRRVSGLKRLYQLPYTLGYRSEPLKASEINPDPHPFS